LFGARRNGSSDQDIEGEKEEEVEKPAAVEREEVQLRTQPNSRCFLLNGVMTPHECAQLIDAAERAASAGAASASDGDGGGGDGATGGWEALSGMFAREYRGGDRLLVMDEQLADGLWHRIKPALTRDDVLRVRPVGSAPPSPIITHSTFRLIVLAQDSGMRAHGGPIGSMNASSWCATSPVITSRTLYHSIVGSCVV
jgi:hypothetical protein